MQEGKAQGVTQFYAKSYSKVATELAQLLIYWTANE